MSTSHRALLLVLVCTALSAQVALASIDCNILQLNGNVYDLSKLSHASLPFTILGDYGVYQFRVCSNLLCGYRGAAACLETARAVYHPIGTFSSNTTVQQTQYGLTFSNAPVLASPSGPWVFSTISVYCDLNAYIPNNISIAGSSEPNVMYFSLWHRSACPGVAGTIPEPMSNDTAPLVAPEDNNAAPQVDNSTAPDASNCTTPDCWNFTSPDSSNFTAPDASNCTTPDCWNFTSPDSSNFTAPEPWNFTSPEGWNSTVPDNSSVPDNSTAPFAAPWGNQDGAVFVNAIAFPSFKAGFCSGPGKLVTFNLAPSLNSCVTLPEIPFAYSVSRCDSRGLDVMTYVRRPYYDCSMPLSNVTVPTSVCLPDLLSGNSNGGIVIIGCDMSS